MPQLPGEMDGWRGALNIAGSQNVSEALPRRGGEGILGRLSVWSTA